MTKLAKEALLKPEQVAKLKELFPQAIVDGKVDFVSLKALLGEQIEEPNEKYQFTWNGKQNAIAHAQKPSLGTLREDKSSSKNFDSTENIYIEGDNLEVLKLLQKTYQGKIKMIYIDPPYNTGNDFVYKDDFKDNVKNYLELTNQKNKSNAETSGRYHTDWLNMMYPRLMLARNLLTEDGVIFISIDDNEQSNLKKICDEIFGEMNFIGQFIWRGGRRNASKYISTSHEYMVSYSKNLNYCSSHNVDWNQKKKGLEQIYNKVQELLVNFKEDYFNASIELQKWYAILPEEDDSKDHSHYSWIDSNGVYFASDISRGGGGGPQWKITNPITNEVVSTPIRGWAYSTLEDLQNDIKKNLIHFNGSGVPCKKRYLKEFETQLVETVLYKDRRGSSKRLRKLMEYDVFQFPKDEEVIKNFLESFSDDSSIILDFFSGSGTTAHAVMKLNSEDGGNRKFIMVQLPEKTEEDSEAYKAGYKNICEIGKERIRRAGEKVKQEMLDKDSSADVSKLDVGFKVFKLDSTNIKPWDGTQDINQMLLEASGNVVKTDRTDLDVVHELMLMYGVFNEEVEEIKINGKTLYSIGEHFLIVCLFKSITKQDIEAIVKLKPKNVIFNDAGFENDNVKINAELTLKNHGVEDIKSL